MTLGLLFSKITVKREISKGGRTIKEKRAKKSTTEIRPGNILKKDEIIDDPKVESELQLIFVPNFP